MGMGFVMIKWKIELLTVLCICFSSTTVDGIKLTVSPSNDVEVNQTVTLRCELDPNPKPPIIVFFVINSTVLCTLEPRNGNCFDTLTKCETPYNASCSNETLYSIQVTVPWNWSGVAVDCKTFYNRSNLVVFTVKVPVTSVTLVPTPINVTVGQQIYITCTTSYCYPPANITWNRSSTNIANQFEFTSNDLVRTSSIFSINASKSDNGKQVYCTASNISGKRVNSTVNMVTVLYKPEVTPGVLSPYRVIEGQTTALECAVIAANPNTSIIWEWSKIDRPITVLSDGPYLILPKIHRNMSGPYNCTASNSVGTSEAGIISVDVLYKPEVIPINLSPHSVIEGQTAALECAVIDANPNTSIIWRWSRTDRPYAVLSEGPNYTIPNIHRNMSGPYNCTASNSVGTSKAGLITVDVLYEPEVIPGILSPYRVIEGQTTALECEVIDANPKTSIIWRWYGTDRSNSVFYYGPNFTIPNIHRNMSGRYNCTASNSVGTSKAGIITVDVLYKPKIADTTSTTVNEGDRVILKKEIVSNPLSNVSWYNGSELLDYQVSVTAATLTIEEATCTDTKNFTLIASNTVEKNVSALVELFVNCKPRSYRGTITLGVTDTSGIDFSTTVIAYPEPFYELRYENGTTSNKMMGSITRNAVNNFTIRLNQTSVEQADFGTYRLLVSNPFGETVVVLNVIPQRKPTMPERVEIVCEVTRARVQWRSSFNGGDPQSFTVIALNGQQRESRSDNISDKGENVIHSTFVQNLQPSTTYVFYVIAQNSHGLSSSENVSCTTLEEDSNDLSFIAGGAAAGGITLAIVLVVVVVVLLRLKKRQNKERNSDKNNPMRTNEDASHYTTLAEQDVTVERNVYEILTQKEGTNQYEACLMKESQETNSQMYESLQKKEISDKRNISDKHMIAKYTKDLSNIYANQSATENSAEYINLSFST